MYLRMLYKNVMYKKDEKKYFVDFNIWFVISRFNL